MHLAAAQDCMEKTRADGPAPAVLVVEDEYLIRLDLCDELRALGIRVIEAGSAGEAVEALRSGLPVAVVVTDIRMPGEGDGLDVARAARDGRCDMRVVAMSGHLVPDERQRELFDLFVSKPFDSTALARRVAELLGDDRAASA